MTSKLQEFLTSKMSMTEVYQPVIIKELLLNGGQRTKTDLALALARYDLSIVDYYKKIVMRWPKITLEKHQVISYDRKSESFYINPDSVDLQFSKVEVDICDTEIALWLDRKANKERTPQANESIRYKILKRAKGKCECCGIPAFVRPIDIDHIVPQSHADKYGFVLKEGQRIELHSESNLQALCIKCNRAKRDSDKTDFRRTSTLVRYKVAEAPAIYTVNAKIAAPANKSLKEALQERLFEEFEKDINGNYQHSVDSLADTLEAFFSIAELYGYSRDVVAQLAEERRALYGSFSKAPNF
ncbi:MAG: HNH endonuclease [Pseudohongiella sp.]|nr:HNH endonuclease [Pseudohongiella sp.]